MAQHNNYQSMLAESIQDTLKIADISIRSIKYPPQLGSGGIYGYPAALLLFSICEVIGSVIYNKDDGRRALRILDNEKYFNLALGQKVTNELYICLRNKLVHSTLIHPLAILDIGNEDQAPIEIVKIDNQKKICLRLRPFYLKVSNATSIFLNEDINQIENTKIYKKMLEKKKLEL